MPDEPDDLKDDQDESTTRDEETSSKLVQSAEPDTSESTSDATFQGRRSTGGYVPT